MKYKFLYKRKNMIDEPDPESKPIFRKFLADAVTHGAQWISMGSLVNEHVVEYDFITYRCAVNSLEEEFIMVKQIAKQMRSSALQYGYIIKELSTDLDWCSISTRRKIIPGINVCGVTQIGLLAKDYNSAELLDVLKI